MTILQFAPQNAEEWLVNFNPQKRALSGDTYLFAKRLMDITLVLLTLPLWLPLMAVIALAHKIDCYKNRVALEIEWSNKDPFFDEILTTSAYCLI